jgi:hypothetical protein
MTRRLAVISGLLAALLALAGHGGRGLAEGRPALSADAIIDKNFRATRVASASAELTFVLTRPVAPVRVLKALTKTRLGGNASDNMRIVWFRSPADLRGTATLLIEHANGAAEILVYVPAERKIRRLLPENDKDSYVGTDFSYADLIGFRPGEWRHQLIRQQRLDGPDDYVVVSVPATPAVAAQSGYAQRMQWIRGDNFLAEKAQDYDDGGRLVKIVTGGDLRQVEPGKDRWQPMRTEVRNTLTGGTTVMMVEDYAIDNAIGADEFTAPALQRGP